VELRSKRDHYGSGQSRKEDRVRRRENGFRTVREEFPDSYLKDKLELMNTREISINGWRRYTALIGTEGGHGISGSFMGATKTEGGLEYRGYRTRDREAVGHDLWCCNM